MILLVAAPYMIQSFSPISLTTRSTTPTTFNIAHDARRSRISLNNSEDSTTTNNGTEEGEKKMSLEDKMKSWEATEDELKAASLGGITTGSKERTDAFDVGLYIAFPIIVLTSLAFLFFPFIVDKIDFSSVGPPPTV